MPHGLQETANKFPDVVRGFFVHLLKLNAIPFLVLTGVLYQSENHNRFINPRHVEFKRYA
jgi:hypothetical protein